jgi:NDP-sugar pyrophosphorylase family protein
VRPKGSKNLKAVITAAGRGRRLHPLTDDRPKPLVNILGKPLLGYVIDSLRRLDVTDIIIVVGYRGDLIRSYFGGGTRYGVQIRYVDNLEFERGEATSVLAAEPLLEKDAPFLLLMADHVVESSLIGEALRNVDRYPLLCIDRSPQHKQPLEDATRVLVDSNGYICDIRKQIPKYNAFGTGVFVVDAEVLGKIRSLSSDGHAFTLNRCWQKLVPDKLQLWACDVSGMFWFDVDTEEDLGLAREALETLLKRTPGRIPSMRFCSNAET